MAKRCIGGCGKTLGYKNSMCMECKRHLSDAKKDFKRSPHETEEFALRGGHWVTDSKGIRRWVWDGEN